MSDDSIIQVTGRNGLVVSTGATLPSSERGFSDIEIDGERHRMITGVLGGDRTIQVARSTEEDAQVLANLFARIALIAVLGAGAAAALGWYIAQRTTSPLRRLATVANEVAQTRDLTVAADLDDAGRPDEIGSLAMSFRSMLDALESSRSQQQRLIEDAGHELRTPLTSMRANVELLERATELPVEQRTEIVTAIKSELIELSELFGEMIDLATDQATTELDLETVDLGDVAQSVANRWTRRSDRIINVVGSGVLVSADRAMIERAASNLVSNAVKFSPAGSPVDVLVEASGGRASLRVRDTGPGIKPEDRALVFDRFHRADETRSMPGSGLGLSIVSQIVARHGGEVWVDDAPGGGAEVGFRLQELDSLAELDRLPVPPAG